MDLVQDGEGGVGGHDQGAQLGGTPGPRQLPATATGVSVAQLEPGRGGVASCGGGWGAWGALSFTSRRGTTGALSGPAERVLSGEPCAYLTGLGEGCRGGEGGLATNILQPLGSKGKSKVEMKLRRNSSTSSTFVSKTRG